MNQLELSGVIDPRAERWTLTIERDEYTENPREWENLGKFFTRSARYVESEFKHESAVNFYDLTLDEVEKKLKKQGYICARVSVYDHSGVNIYIGRPCCRWDSGYIGLYVVNKQRAREWFNVKRITTRLKKKILDTMESEVNTFNNWLNGNIFYFNVERNGEQLDSCGGFIADSERDALDSMMEYLPDELTRAFNVEEIRKLAGV